MKRYIRNSYSWKPKFEGTWSEEEKKLWESIDWEARDYEEYPVESDTIQGEVKFVGTNYEPVPAKFIKYIEPNPIFGPYYAPVEEGKIKQILDHDKILGPMRGATHNGYPVMNRYETAEVYDMMSR